MKNLKLLSLICFLITIESCTKKEHSCQNLKMKKEHSGICPENCPGVKGCDGKTYCNECDANRNGITVVY
jgi:hypothetical protein